MKRVKASGAFFRKKKKGREEELQKCEGAILKFVSSSNSFFSSAAPTNKNIVDSGELQVDMEQAPPTLATVEEEASVETDMIEHCAGSEVEENDVNKSDIQRFAK